MSRRLSKGGGKRYRAPQPDPLTDYSPDWRTRMADWNPVTPTPDQHAAAEAEAKGVLEEAKTFVVRADQKADEEMWDTIMKAKQR